jgi:hypothetical protein
VSISYAVLLWRLYYAKNKLTSPNVLMLLCTIDVFIDPSLSNVPSDL